MFGDTGQALHKRKADVCTIKISDNHSWSPVVRLFEIQYLQQTCVGMCPQFSYIFYWLE